MRLISELRHLPEFVKISHSVFALPFALAALFLGAAGMPRPMTLLLVIGAVVTARFAAMAFNRIVDRRWDALNPRTVERHLPARKVSLPTAWMVVIISILLFIAIAWKINALAFQLSPVALLAVLGYSFTKRFTSFSHFFLGAALGIAPLGAWVAARGELASPIPWLMGLAVLCWVAGFDIIYALQDEAFDRSQQLHSMVVRWGTRRALGLVRVLHGAMWMLLVAIGILAHSNRIYFAGVAAILLALIWEQWLMREAGTERLQKAFFEANAIVSFSYFATVVLSVMTS